MYCPFCFTKAVNFLNVKLFCLILTINSQASPIIINRFNGDEVINGGWGDWELGNCTFVGHWSHKPFYYDRCERKDTRKCNNPEFVLSL